MNGTPENLPPGPPDGAPRPGGLAGFLREHWILVAGVALAGLIVIKGLMPETGAGTSTPAGQAAKDFSLSDLDGKKVSLASFRGKNVVILDFWATWCPPCRMTMPVLQKLKDTFESRGLVILSINQREDSGTVRAFMRQNGLTIRVLLDLDGGAAGAWGVSGLPTLFIIDKEGRVRQQEVGFDSGMESRLTGAVSGLL